MGRPKKIDPKFSLPLPNEPVMPVSEVKEATLAKEVVHQRPEYEIPAQAGPEVKPPVSGVQVILDKHGFNPIEEMIELYRKGEEVMVMKDGTTVTSPLGATTKARILDNLASYVYSKRKSEEGNSGPKKVTVVIQKEGFTIDV